MKAERDESRKINTEPCFGGMHFGRSDRCRGRGMVSE